jgi:hypothetical protein
MVHTATIKGRTSLGAHHVPALLAFVAWIRKTASGVGRVRLVTKATGLSAGNSLLALTNLATQACDVRIQNEASNAARVPLDSREMEQEWDAALKQLLVMHAPAFLE